MRCAAAATIIALCAGCARPGTAPPGSEVERTAGDEQPDSRLVAVSVRSSVPGGSGLVLVDTVAKKIMAYRLAGSAIRLGAVRSYQHDLRVGTFDEQAGRGLSYEEARRLVPASGGPRTGRRNPGDRELVRVLPGGNQGSDRLVLIEPVEGRMLVYRLDRGPILLVAVRLCDEDAERSPESIVQERRAAEIAGRVSELSHRLSSVRRDAAQALGRMSPPAAEATPALERALGDRASDVRAAAAVALEAIRKAGNSEQR